MHFESFYLFCFDKSHSLARLMNDFAQVNTHVLLLRALLQVLCMLTVKRKAQNAIMFLLRLNGNLIRVRTKEQRVIPRVRVCIKR